MERIVTSYSGDWYVDCQGDNGVYMGCEAQLVRHDDANEDKAHIIRAALDRWDRLGRPPRDRFIAALATLVVNEQRVTDNGHAAIQSQPHSATRRTAI